MTTIESLSVNEETNPRIPFPHPINEQDLMNLFRYHNSNQNGTETIHLYLESSRTIGGDYTDKKQEIPETVGYIEKISKINGMIRNRNAESASFTVEREFNETTGERYLEIQFNITPGYDPGINRSDDLKIMKSLGVSAYSFFKALHDN
ncbi:MAG TPA: hypothetical protein VJK51_05560 [Candidatus Nanoarchaeia archaeon]|nr:hypothetical protein [Candidatus Nanoarchaeia archaeon]